MSSISLESFSLFVDCVHSCAKMALLLRSNVRRSVDRAYVHFHQRESRRQTVESVDGNLQSHNDSASSWTERSVSPGSAVVSSSASRPQTPAFPVHPRTPYVNNSSPTVTFAADRSYSTNATYNLNNNNNNMNNVESAGNNNNNVGNYGERTIYIEERREVSKETGLPPKSPTTQRWAILIFLLSTLSCFILLII